MNTMVKNYSLLLSFVLFATINVVAQLKVLPNGNVGIGTNNPLQKIQIGNIWTFHNGGTKFIGRNVTYTSQGNIRIEDGYSSMLSFDEYGKISLLAGGTINERGNCEIQIQAGQLPAGIYTYILIADGKASETKQMILTK